MREILFRGKTVRWEWVTGLLAHVGNAWYISNKAGVATAYEVIPNTVEQYTGLKDKNGRKIFEGDVVKEADVVHNGEIQIRGKVFSVSMRKGCWVVIPASDTEEWDFLNSYLPHLEVIGNIHDNPELLEVSEDGH